MSYFVLLVLLSAAAELKEEDPTVFEHIGDTYSMEKQTGKALEYWQKSLALDPDNTRLAGKIADAKARLSKGESAGATPIK